MINNSSDVGIGITTRSTILNVLAHLPSKTGTQGRRSVVNVHFWAF